MMFRARHVARGVKLAAAGVVTSGLALGFPHMAKAQAWNYPAFQQSHIVDREFNFGVADGGNAGTSLLAQWREKVSPVEQLSLDGGMAFGSGQSTVFVGGQYAFQFLKESSDNPIELLGVGGVNAAFMSGDVLFRLPVGASIGHAFAIAPDQAITPFIMPRLELDFCTSCGYNMSGRQGSAKLGIGADFGVNMDITPQWSLRVAGGFGGTSIFSHDDTFGISLAWRPPGLRH